MSSIYKLSICGIRSFSDESQETIQFSKPLTLIVGTNGSGKTTIIECLRYATTNELPPNTKTGASFINDPNLHSSNETKAQIKLAFQNTKRVNLILSKSLMAIKNPRTKTISFKTKENQLMAIHHGEKQTISSKVADIENLIPQHLGVSKAILNYVVFCHQDESLWPISESAVLKKKFDEIFDSSKFIKILENVKTMTKDINATIKLINNNVEHLKNDKVRAASKRKSIGILQSRIRENQAVMDEKQSQIDELTLKLQKVYTSNQDYERTISKIESLEQDKKNMLKNIESLKLTTDLLNRPKEILLDELANFENVLSNQAKQCETLQHYIDDNNSKIVKLRNELNQTLVQSGNLKSLHEKYLENLQERDDMMGEFTHQLAIDDISQFDSKLSSELSRLSTLYNQKKSDYEQLTKEISDKLLSLQFAKSNESKHLQYLSTDKENLYRRMQEFESRYENITGHQTKLKSLKAKLDSEIEKLKKLKTSNEIHTLNMKIDEKNNELISMEIKLENLQRKLKESRISIDIHTKLKILKDLNDSSSRDLNSSLANVTKEFPDLSKDTLGDSFESNMKTLDTEINRKRSELETQKFRRSKSKIDYDVSLASLGEKQEQIKSYETQFLHLNDQYKSIYGDNLTLEKYENIMDDIELDYNDEFQQSKEIQFLSGYYTKAKKSADEDHNCLLCRRKFNDSDPKDQERLSAFSGLLKVRLNRLSSREGFEENVKRKELFLNSLRDFKSNALKLLHIKKEEIPKLSHKIEEQKRSLLQYDETINKIELDLEEKRGQLKKMKILEHDVSVFKHHSEAIKERELEIERLQQTIEESGMFEDTEELERQNSLLYKALKDTRNGIESLKLNRDAKQRRNTEIEKGIDQMKLSINELELKSLDKLNIEKAIEEIKSQIKDIEKSFTLSQDKIVELDSSIAEYESQLKNQNIIKQDDLSKIQNQVEELEKIKKHFSQIDEEIKGYIDNNIEAKLSEANEKIDRINSQITQLSFENEKKSAELKRLEAAVSDSSHQERNIRANLNLIQFEEDIVSLDDQIDQLDIKKAYAQRSEYLSTTAQLQEQQKQYQRELATKLGETTQLERQVTDIADEIERDYKDIDKRYMIEYAKLQTKLAMATDLTTVYKSVDNGVMEYHQTQMAKINNILDELWKKTYTGNDVETIMIKSDPIQGKKKSDTMATNNRSYNYRVVMIKNGTELDMRGRCSAGQRVLASIIIRIALAECFCLNFGMIALDEPTTNLDDENIESLARALHSIIRERAVQRNFQLIIITHDEKFLRCMNAVDFTDHYYKVIRDERLNSTINKVSIATVTE